MDWPNERYVRVYTRDTTTWKLLDWRGRTVLSLLFRKVDRAGVLDVGHDGVLGLAAVLELPLEIVEAGIAQLTTSRGGQPTVVDTGTAYVLPNFIEAQEAPQSDPQRKRESRARRRDVALAVSRKLLLAAGSDPDGHETGHERDENTDEVTPIRSVPIRSVPDQSSLPPARDPAVPAPAPTPVPAAPPALLPGPLVTTPAEIRAELERAPAPTVPPGESGWHRRLRWWGAMLEADARIRAAGIEPNAPALPKAPAGVHEQNMLRCERQILDGGATPAEADAKMRHVVLVAEAEAMRSDNRSRRWFKPALIWDPERAARAVDTSLAEASKPRAPKASTNARPAPVPATAPVPTKHETALPVVVSAAERAEAAEMALELRARLFGEARAPPASSSPTTDQQPTPAKAAT